MTSSARPGPTVFVLFGATGDLAKRMVLPAFYRLAKENLLPEKWMLVGNGRGDVSHYDFQQHVHEVLTQNGETLQDGAWGDFKSSGLRFAGGGFDKDDPGSLLDVIAEARKHTGEDAQLVHYLAVPPVAFESNTEGLGEHDLAKGSRVVYEKPFGTSPEGFRKSRQARAQGAGREAGLSDRSLPREGGDAEPARAALRQRHVRHHLVQQDDAGRCRSTSPSTLGIADRAEFYDATGAVLDMLVTHLFQVAAEIAMEPPASLSADDLQSAREEVIGCFRPIDPKEVVLGQFDGYLDTEGIDKKSKTDTFVAAKLWVDNDRWKGVPFLLRTGKRLHASHQRVSLILRDPDGPLSGDCPGRTATCMSFELSGNGAISIEMVAKKPGAALKLETATAVLPLSNR